MNNSGAATGSKWLLWALGVLIALIGLGLAGGGGYLVSLGGSWFFLLMGLAMIVSGLLIARRNPRGAWLYGVALVLTAIWAVWDAGLEYWPLVSRVLTFAVIGLVVALIYPTLVRASGATAGRGAYGLAGVLGIGVVATLAYMFVPTHVVKASSEPAIKPVAPGTEQKDWAHWGNTTAGNRFAALDQINKGNIDQLQVAWTFRTGDIPQSTGAGAEDQNTPLQIGDTVYTCTAYGKVFALDADTGAERWKFDPQGSAPNWQRCRGLGYFDASAEPGAEATAAPAACTKRLFLPTGDARLIAINAQTGKPCEDFGDKGTVDLKTDMGGSEAWLLPADLDSAGGRQCGHSRRPGGGQLFHRRAAGRGPRLRRAQRRTGLGLGSGQPEHHQASTGGRDLHPRYAERLVGHVL